MEMERLTLRFDATALAGRERTRDNGGTIWMRSEQND
jgi:hypothetical protein